jgi:hypothetical protein
MQCHFCLNTCVYIIASLHRKCLRKTWVGSAVRFWMIWELINSKSDLIRTACRRQLPTCCCNSQAGWPDWANFAYWAIVHFGQSFEHFKRWTKFWATISVLNVTYSFSRKKWIGLHFGRFLHKLIRSPCSQAKLGVGTLNNYEDESNMFQTPVQLFSATPPQLFTLLAMIIQLI